MKTLVVVTGATASGKTTTAIALAKKLGCDIISADSRQIYRDIPIITAAPSPDELAAVKHHFIGILPLDAYYSAARFEEDVMALLPELWRKNDYVVMAGGSMMYIDAVTHGIDPIPTVSDEIRRRVKEIYDNEGLEAVTAMLGQLDPDYLTRVDRANTRRIVHAVEVSLQAGIPYSTMLTGNRRQRDFRVVKLALDMPREILFARINARVEAMEAAGMEAEAWKVFHLRHLNSLNTVGFKEMFAYFDGTMDRATALARIAKNTRVYAKKQLTWLRRDPDVRWISPSEAATLDAASL